MMNLIEDPMSKLMLPRQFVDEKQALKKVIDDYVDKAINSCRSKENYFITLHAKFDRFDSTQFQMNAPIVTKKLPPFVSNTLVFWISPKRGVRELLWMVSARKRGEKLKVEFNKQGVAYLQAKGAMPKAI